MVISNSNIEYIKDPSEAEQLATVNQNGLAIRYIENPSEEVQLAAVSQHGSALEYIKKSFRGCTTCSGIP